jgi:hypothetical protein
MTKKDKKKDKDKKPDKGSKQQQQQLPEPLETQRHYVLCGPDQNSHVSSAGTVPAMRPVELACCSATLAKSNSGVASSSGSTCSSSSSVGLDFAAAAGMYVQKMRIS